MIAEWINRAWMLACRGEVRRFEHAIRHVHRTQTSIWQNIISTNSRSVYGLRYGLERIRSIDEYRERIPMVRYETLSDEISRIGNGESNVLTCESVDRLVPTSGSSGGVKLIPYTASLKKEFQRAIATWIGSTFRTFPSVMKGRAYWSVTPMAEHPKRSDAGIPIGFESDSEYLGVGAKWFAERLVLPPSGVTRLQDIDNARYATLCYLLACADLALISVWSPTFLTSLLASIDGWFESMVGDIRQGIIHLPKPAVENLPRGLDIKANRSRADQLLSNYKRLGLGKEFYHSIWPQLTLVSCWGDSNSAAYRGQVQTMLPHATIQPKGLLATECVISLPRPVPVGCTLAVRSHFFEFVPYTAGNTDSHPTTYLAHELSLGGRYRVIVTTSGGLYRYDLGDVIEVVGFESECPSIQFIGRAEAVSDLVGEKLNENHVREMIELALRETGLQAPFYVLVAFPQNTPVYKLILTEDTPNVGRMTESLRAILDAQLRTNPQYDLARKLNQLSQVEIAHMPMKSVDLWKRFEKWHSQRGRRVGDIKPAVLDCRGIWYDFLKSIAT